MSKDSKSPYDNNNNNNNNTNSKNYNKRNSNSNTNKININSIHSNASTTSKIESLSPKETNNSPFSHLIIQKISDLLTDICDEGKSTSKNNSNTNKIKVFFSKKIPQKSIKDYLIRLYKYSKMSDSTLVLMLIYLDKICEMNKFKLTYYNIHKLLLASMIVAIKFNEDEYFSIDYYSKVGGVNIKEMKNLEYEFACLMNFRLFVDEDLFNKYNNYIIASNDSDDNNNDSIDSNEEIKNEKNDNNNDCDDNDFDDD